MTVYHVWRIGFSNHIANLTSTVASYFFAFGILFKYTPQLAHFRPFPFFNRSFFGVKQTQIDLLSELNNQNVSSLIKECIDSARIDLLEAAQNALDPYCGFRNGCFGVADDIPKMKLFLLLGYDINRVNLKGENFLLKILSSDWDLAANSRWDLAANSRVEAFFQSYLQVDPRLRKPFDIHHKDQQGFDAISRVLTGICNPAQCDCFQLEPENLARLVECLIEQGAAVPCTKFEEYRDFVNEVNECLPLMKEVTSSPSQQEDEAQLIQLQLDALNSALSNQLRNRLEDPNPLIRLAARCLTACCSVRNEDELWAIIALTFLLTQARTLVELKPRIEVLRTEFQKPYQDVVAQTFAEIGTPLPKGSNDPLSFQKEPIAHIIAEYLASKHFDPSSL
jgi:hypothetical protein